MYELKIVRERRQGYGTVRRVRDAAQVYEAFKEEFSQLDREMFVALLLDGKNQVLGFNIVSYSCLNSRPGPRIPTSATNEVSTSFAPSPIWLIRASRRIRSSGRSVK